MKPEISAVIVARKGSQRIPSKSMQMIGGKTLIQLKIEELKKTRYVDRVIVGSDCEEMLAHAESLGAEAVERPEFFCNEQKASANQMIGNMCSLISTDVVVWAHCTNPLLSSSTFDSAISTYLDNIGDFDSLLSVVEIKEHLWDEHRKPINYDPFSERHTPARELPPYYMQDGGIFIQGYEAMTANSYFFGKKPYLFKIPQNEFCDINDGRDLVIARALYNEMHGPGKV